MYPTLDEKEIAEEIAGFFNSISREYQAIPPPSPSPADYFGRIENYQISARLKTMKKPKTKIPGDIDRRLNEAFSDVIAQPLTYIFNLVTATVQWPDSWKLEHVSAVPKTQSPESPAELRNLSCTPLYSKLLESFVLDRLKAEVPLSRRQYGGQKGCGVDNFLVETWQHILEDLEDNRAGTSLLSIDFEKAFNGMDHAQCINDLKNRGASPGLISMVSAFLHGRKMTVRIGDQMSDPRPAPGGSPQGSIMGNYLFCVTVDALTDRAEAAPPPTQEPRQRLLPIGAEARASTPIRNNGIDLEYDSEDEDQLDESIRFFRQRRARPYDSSDDETSYIMPQGEIDGIMGIPERWTDRQVEVLSYIDDFNCVEKVKIINSVSHISQTKRKCLVHSQQAENLFFRVKRVAKDKGMRVNDRKTQLLCITASHDEVKSYIKSEGRRILSSDSLKILGYTFGDRPNPQAHLDSVLPKLRRRLWLINKLLQSGMRQRSLKTVYFSMIRSLAEFGAVAFHSLLNIRQTEELESIQRRALKAVYGYDRSYRTILSSENIPTMKARRAELLLNFAEKTARNPRFAPWFPLKPDTGYETRRRPKYLEFTARTERLNKSPIYEMRRLLNSR